ncbi:MAG: inositol monophosphatase family protein [Armatimonadota bacterium]
MNLQRTTEIIIGIAQEAGAGVLAQYGNFEAIEKYDGTLVTEADPEAEALIRKRLKQHFPGHSIYGEEMGFEGPQDNPFTWYIDPIDGTSNYIFGLPIWGVSIGLVHEGRCVAGVFEMPPVRETYWGWDGGGAFRNGQRLLPSKINAMRPNDLICVSSSALNKYDMSFPQKARCMGSAAHGLVGVAAGHFVGMVHDNWRLHDIAAGLVMCQETGIVATTDDGTVFDSFNGCDPNAPAPALILAPAALHGKLMECVRRK